MKYATIHVRRLAAFVFLLCAIVIDISAQCSPAPTSRIIRITYDADVSNPISTSNPKPLINAPGVIMYGIAEVRDSTTSCFSTLRTCNPLNSWNGKYEGESHWRMTNIPGTSKWVIEFNMDSLYGDPQHFIGGSGPINVLQPNEIFAKMRIQFREAATSPNMTIWSLNSFSFIDVDGLDQTTQPISYSVYGNLFTGLTVEFIDASTADLETSTGLGNNYFQEYSSMPVKQAEGLEINTIGKNNGPLLSEEPQIKLTIANPSLDTLTSTLRIYSKQQIFDPLYKNQYTIFENLPEQSAQVFSSGNNSNTLGTVVNGPGTYTLSYDISSIQNDTVVANNIYSEEIVLSDTVIARDDGVFQGSIPGGNGYDQEYGHLIKLLTADSISSISGFLTTPPIGEPICYKVYSYQNGQIGSLIASTDTSLISSVENAYSPGVWKTLPFSSNVSLDSGIYLISYHQLSTTPITLGYSTNKYEPHTVFRRLGLLPWEDLESTSNQASLDPSLMLRANFSGLGGSNQLNNLTYCSSSPFYNSDSRIDTVLIAGETKSIMSFTNTATNNSYSDYSDQIVDFAKGQEYGVGIALGNYSPNPQAGYPKTSRILVDWNQDGDFSDSMEVFISVTDTLGVPTTPIQVDSIKVPSFAKLGLTKMRIICWETGYNVPDSLTFCGQYSWGETEDYQVEVIEQGYCRPPLDLFQYNSYTGTNTIGSVSILNQGNFYTFYDPSLCTDSAIIKYSKYSQPSNVTPGTPISIFVDLRTCDYSTKAAYFADWDRDFFWGPALDTIEIQQSTLVSFTDSIPIDASPGNVVIRINAIENGDYGGDAKYPCTNYYYGETKDFIISIINANDIAITDIDISGITCGTSTTPVNVTVCNEGEFDQSNFPVIVSTPDTSVTYLFPGTLIAGQCTTITALTFDSSTGGDYLITASSVLLNDQVPSNNYQSRSFQIFTTATPSIDATPVCGQGTSILTATVNNQFAGPVHWYNISGTQIGIGQTFTTPVLTNSQNYLARVGVTTGCISPFEFVNVSVHPAVSFTTSSTDVDCFGGQTGSANVFINSGTPPFSFDWGAAGTGASIDSLFSGIYGVTVTDANNCQASQNITITQPASDVVSTPTATNVDCFGANNGTITVTGSGGTPGYTYALNTGAFQSSNTFSGLTAGTYDVIVKDSNNCEDSQNITITQPASDVVSTPSATNVDCFGTNNGTITVTGSGGTPGYTYALNTGAFQSSNTFSGLTAGTYDVIVKDSNNCEDSQNITITQPASAVVSTPTATNVDCFGANNGTITVTGSGGTPGYTYILNNVAFQTSNIFMGLSAGTYNVKVKDSNNCEDSQTITITQPFALTIAPTVTNLDCNGVNDGSIILSVSGGTPGYSYALNNGSFQPSNSFTGLSAGTYTVKVKDANDCEEDQSATITQPTQLQLSLVLALPAQCNTANGGLSVLGAGGTGQLQYAIDGGVFGPISSFLGLTSGSHTVSIRDSKLCQIDSIFTVPSPNSPVASFQVVTNIDCYNNNTGVILLSATGGAGSYQYSLNGTSYQPSGTFQNLSASNYTAFVRDTNNCITQLQFSISQPDSLMLEIDSTVMVSCYGLSDGEIYLNAQGGSGNYIYSLVSSGNPSSNPFGKFSMLEADSYGFEVSDNNNCISSKSGIITQPDSLKITLQIIIDESCPGAMDGSISAPIITGGTMPYTFWKGPDTAQFPLTNLGAGQYSFEIRDNNQCVKQFNTTIVTQDSLPVAGFDITQINGDSIILNNTSTANAVSFSWDFGDGQTSISKNPVHTYQSNGPFELTLIATGPCGSDTITKDVIITVGGISDVDFRRLNIFPNPTDGLFTISGELINSSNVEIKIYDSRGRLVEERVTHQAILFDEKIDLTGSAEGVYLIRITTRSGAFTKQIAIK